MIEVIGAALRVIQGAKLGPNYDGPLPYGTGPPVPPAYELDE